VMEEGPLHPSSSAFVLHSNAFSVPH
jgi:hypothetical protein